MRMSALILVLVITHTLPMVGREEAQQAFSSVLVILLPRRKGQ